MGKGGSSNSQTIVNNNVDFKPTTEVQNEINIPLEDLVSAIRDTSGNQLNLEKAKYALTRAGLNLQKADLLQEQEKLKTQKDIATLNFLKDEKTRNQLTILVLLIGGSYIYKHLGKKGKK